MKRKKMKMKLMILMMVTLLLLLQCNDQPELADRVSVVPVLSICDALEHAATSLPHKHAKKPWCACSTSARVGVQSVADEPDM